MKDIIDIHQLVAVDSNYIHNNRKCIKLTFRIYNVQLKKEPKRFFWEYLFSSSKTHKKIEEKTFEFLMHGVRWFNYPTLEKCGLDEEVALNKILNQLDLLHLKR